MSGKGGSWECAFRSARRALRGRAACLLAAALPILLVVWGCDDEEICCPVDWQPPAPPAALWTETGDGEVWLFWYPSVDGDLGGYSIFRGRDPRGQFARIATVAAASTRFLDHGLRNGETWYYAIAAFDQSGNESELAWDVPQDTPRPSGYGLRLTNSVRAPELAGYDFSTRGRLDHRDLEADIYFWNGEESGAWMIATERSDDVYTDIQDAGYVPLERVDISPTEGWTPAGEVPLILGHSYVVWTWDNHFAKFRVTSVNEDRVILDWAYQVDPGNVQLAVPGAERNTRRPGGGRRAHAHGLERRIGS